MVFNITITSVLIISAQPLESIIFRCFQIKSDRQRCFTMVVNNRSSDAIIPMHRRSLHIITITNSWSPSSSPNSRSLCHHHHDYHSHFRVKEWKRSGWSLNWPLAFHSYSLLPFTGRNKNAKTWHASGKMRQKAADFKRFNILEPPSFQNQNQHRLSILYPCCWVAGWAGFWQV